MLDATADKKFSEAKKILGKYFQKTLEKLQSDAKSDLYDVKTLGKVEEVSKLSESYITYLVCNETLNNDFADIAPLMYSILSIMGGYYAAYMWRCEHDAFVKVEKLEDRLPANLALDFLGKIDLAKKAFGENILDTIHNFCASHLNVDENILEECLPRGSKTVMKEVFGKEFYSTFLAADLSAKFEFGANILYDQMYNNKQ